MAGDLLAGGFLRGRAPREPYFADDRQQLRASIERVLRASEAPLYIGHRGPLEPRSVARRFNVETGAPSAGSD